MEGGVVTRIEPYPGQKMLCIAPLDKHIHGNPTSPAHKMFCHPPTDSTRRPHATSTPARREKSPHSAHGVSRLALSGAARVLNARHRAACADLPIFAATCPHIPPFSSLLARCL